MRSQFSQQIVLLVIIAALLSGCSQNTSNAPAALPPTALASTSSPIPAISATTGPTAPAQAPDAQGWQVIDAGRVQFQPNSTGWHTPGDLSPHTAIHFTLSAMKGQQMSVWLTTEPAQVDSPRASLYITGADGKVFTAAPTTYWSGVLESSQDYAIEIRSLAEQPITYSLRIEIPAAVIDPALGNQYEPIAGGVCQMLQETASQALAIDFTLEDPAPFLDPIAGEAGQGCRLTAVGDGSQFAGPQPVVESLVGSVGLGWNEQPSYQAGGPTGAATALARDMGLMLIQANWAPAQGVICPAGRPISDCALTPDQKIYTVSIDVAQYRATFSLDGHWEDASTGFSLDLYQDWKAIYGHHTMVAQGGSKIDTLEVSINGYLKQNVAAVQFQSAFTNDVGQAQITYLDVNTLSWKITNPPDGEYYLPAEATLTRK